MVSHRNLYDQHSCWPFPDTPGIVRAMPDTPEEVEAAVEAIHAEPDDDKSLEMERSLVEETDKGEDHVPDEPLA